MKKLILVFLVALAIVSCQKKETQPTPPATQDVTFAVTEIIPDFKSTDVWECVDNTPTNAWIVINGDNYYPELFEVDGQLYTQAIKLAATDGVDNTGDEYCISTFILFDNVDGNPGYTPPADPTNPPVAGEDVIVYGTPVEDNDNTKGYDTYVQWPLDQCFEVSTFAKAQIPMEVLCFQPAEYEYFGFDWYAITEIVIREQCFFGDFCMKHPYDYIQSNYHLQAGFPQTAVPFWDAPAIVSINVYKVTQSGDVEVDYSPFTNNTAEAGYGVGGPVCIQYPDNLSIDGEKFKVVLNILVKQGNLFKFLPFKEWTFEDDEMIETKLLEETEDDGIVDFVLGSCNLSNTNLQLPPWQNLPESAEIYISNPADPGYWGFLVNSVTPAGVYDFGPTDPNEPWIGWCGDEGTTIVQNRTYTFYTCSSLYPSTWPTNYPSFLTTENLNKVNWLFNNLHIWNITWDNMTNDQGDDLQDAVWKLLQNNGSFNQYSTAAFSHGDYVPLPGGYAAVLLFRNNGDSPYEFQMLLVQVDP